MSVLPPLIYMDKVQPGLVDLENPDASVVEKNSPHGTDKLPGKIKFFIAETLP